MMIISVMTMVRYCPPLLLLPSTLLRACPTARIVVAPLPFRLRSLFRFIARIRRTVTAAASTGSDQRAHNDRRNRAIRIRHRKAAGAADSDSTMTAMVRTAMVCIIIYHCDPYRHHSVPIVRRVRRRYRPSLILTLRHLTMVPPRRPPFMLRRLRHTRRSVTLTHTAASRSASATCGWAN